jgi:hypothetical protein
MGKDEIKKQNAAKVYSPFEKRFCSVTGCRFEERHALITPACVTAVAGRIEKHQQK